MIHNQIKEREPIRQRLQDDFDKYVGNGGKVEKLPQHAVSSNGPRFNNKGDDLTNQEND